MDEKEFKCGYMNCGKAFTSEKGLRLHRAKMHHKQDKVIKAPKEATKKDDVSLAEAIESLNVKIDALKEVRNMLLEMTKS